MRKVIVIGIGAGDPEHLTLQAIRAMNEVDVFLHLDKGPEKHQLAQLRKDLCRAHVKGDYRWVEADDPERPRTAAKYVGSVDEWHQARARLYEHMLVTELGDDDVAGILVWGDPGLYDSTLRVLEHVRAGGKVAFEHRVVPGITSMQTLAAQHKVCWNRTAGAVHVTTGRRLFQGMPAGVDDVFVLLDAECNFKGVPPQTLIFWGAYLGTDQEILLSGTVGEIGPEIERARAEARSRMGWIMDTYLLRNP